MAKLYNLARMTTGTTGTGTITLGSAVASFLTFSQAGVQNGETITYAIQDGSNREIGRGVYTSSGTTLTRSVLKSTNGDSAISLSGSAQVFITAAAEDFLFIPPRTYAEASNATPTPNADTTDIHVVTAQAAGATWAAPTGTPFNGQVLILRMKDNGTARSVGWNGIYRATTEAPLPTTTVISKELYSAFIYDSTANKWDHMGSRNVA